MEWIYKSGVSLTSRKPEKQEDHHPIGLRSGRFKMFNNVSSRYLPSRRNVIIFLPPSYWKVKRRFPVVYFHDGNNLFDPRTAFLGCPWGLDWQLDQAWKNKQAEEFIVVGAFNTIDRHEEYTPTFDLREKAGGLAVSYLRFLSEELKPLVDQRFRTLQGPQHTAIAGSSLGGLISLYGAFSRPDVFGKAAAYSPSIWWDERFILHYIAAKAPLKRCENTSIWIDMGTQEGATLPNMEAPVPILEIRKVKEILTNAGFDTKRLGYLEINGGKHNERDWGVRSPRVFSFLFPRRRRRGTVPVRRIESSGDAKIPTHARRQKG